MMVMTTRKTPFVSVHLTEPARDALRRAVLDLTSDAGRRISMSDVVLHAIEVALCHRQELIAAIKDAASE